MMCAPELEIILQEYQSVICTRFYQSECLYDFLLEFRHILDQAMRNKSNIQKRIPKATAYTKIMEEIEHIGWNLLTDLSEDLKSLYFKIVDSSHVAHIVQIVLSHDHPTTPPKCSLDVPIAIEILWNSNISTLKDVYNQCEGHIELFQDFWRQCDELDSKTCIIEPENPKKSETFRRIAISKFVSLHIQIDPKSPRTIPECRFLGADSAIQSIREKFNRNLHQWDIKKTVKENLEFMIETELPVPALNPVEEFNIECAICYAFKLDNVIPDRICDNSNCGRAYHNACLYEWLASVRTNRQSFDTIFGECPYCQNPITCKNPNK